MEVFTAAELFAKGPEQTSPSEAREPGTLGLETPLKAAFIPVVPDTASGGWVGLSQTSAPRLGSRQFFHDATLVFMTVAVDFSTVFQHSGVGNPRWINHHRIRLQANAPVAYSFDRLTIA